MRQEERSPNIEELLLNKCEEMNEDMRAMNKRNNKNSEETIRKLDFHEATMMEIEVILGQFQDFLR